MQEDYTLDSDRKRTLDEVEGMQLSYWALLSVFVEPLFPLNLVIPSPELEIQRLHDIIRTKDQEILQLRTEVRNLLQTNAHSSASLQPAVVIHPHFDNYAPHTSSNQMNFVVDVASTHTSRTVCIIAVMPSFSPSQVEAEMEMKVGEDEFVPFNNYKIDKFVMETVVETREFPNYKRYIITFKVRIGGAGIGVFGGA